MNTFSIIGVSRLLSHGVVSVLGLLVFSRLVALVTVFRLVDLLYLLVQFAQLVVG